MVAGEVVRDPEGGVDAPVKGTVEVGDEPVDRLRLEGVGVALMEPVDGLNVLRAGPGHLLGVAQSFGAVVALPEGAKVASKRRTDHLRGGRFARRPESRHPIAEREVWGV